MQELGLRGEAPGEGWVQRGTRQAAVQREQEAGTHPAQMQRRWAGGWAFRPHPCAPRLVLRRLFLA